MSTVQGLRLIGRRRALVPWLLPLVAALLVRLAVWWILPYQGHISDEAEYLAAATWLADGRGFSFFKDWIWTRPPLYVIFVAAHVFLFGPHNLAAIRFSQALLSSATVGLAMLWAARLAPAPYARRVALVAGWAMALSYGLATYAFLLLSETLFIALLLLGLLLLTLWAQDHAERGRDWRQVSLLAGGGVALGLAALTRGMVAGALPLFALWVWWQSNRDAAARNKPLRSSVVGRRSSVVGRRSLVARALWAPALLTVVVSAVILPWSLYNSRFFGGGLILIDTTGGYNALLGVQAGRDQARVSAALDAIPDHAARQAFAYRETWNWITAHPGAFALKTGRELLDLLTISYGGAERLRSGHTEGDVPIPHLLGLLADDTLYMLATPLAALGLARRQRCRGKGLALGWLGYNLVTGPLFFAINRFRLPLLPVIFVYAACAVTQLGERWPSARQRRLGYGAAGLLALVLLPSFVYWPPALDPQRLSVLQHTLLGIESRLIARDCRRAEQALQSGDLPAARQAVEHGSEHLVTRGGLQVALPCFHLLAAEIDLRSGDAEAALEALQAVEHGSEHLVTRGGLQVALPCFHLLAAEIDLRSGDAEGAQEDLQAVERRPERFLLEGAAYRQLGDLDRARGAFVARELENANPTGWAWRHLQPPPAWRIDLGSGLDWGYVDGFYGREGRAENPGNYRWTGPHARLRFPQAGTGGTQRLRLHIAGWRPAGEAPARLTVLAADGQIELGTSFETVEVDLPPVPRGADVVVELRSTMFVPGPDDLAKNQGLREQLRFLGAQLDWAELTPQVMARGATE